MAQVAETSLDREIAEEDRLRADWYGLLARLLGDAPDRALLDRIAELGGGEGELGETLTVLARAAQAADAAEVRQEYFDLFVGIGQGELVPFGSYYLTGFLHEKPLAKLRQDMRRLGLARADDVKEPEDGIASEMEMMAALITGAFSAPADLSAQRAFFERHIAVWAPRFFEDLEAAKAARFYMPVGTLGRLFMAIEAQAFEMAA
ncbi:TorD/DmsD family molecular chaperone [Algihabitans albus]|uniref:TorD/DmsD family molecular chaperone n=1 Tax=Algihabitans albus TaxID=2164067 RepID=UPI000E5C956E|nr:molecular chaperone TorD family protein [Algihabitans albus]